MHAQGRNICFCLKLNFAHNITKTQPSSQQQETWTSCLFRLLRFKVDITFVLAPIHITRMNTTSSIQEPKREVVILRRKTTSCQAAEKLHCFSTISHSPQRHKAIADRRRWTNISKEVFAIHFSTRESPLFSPSEILSAKPARRSGFLTVV
jgi:hypothetical protein